MQLGVGIAEMETSFRGSREIQAELIMSLSFSWIENWLMVVVEAMFNKGNDELGTPIC